MNNLKDFPSEILDLYGIKAKFPDDFLTDIIDLDAEIAVLRHTYPFEFAGFVFYSDTYSRNTSLT